MGLALWLLTALVCRKRSIVLKAVVFQEAINVVFVIKNYEGKDIANIFKSLLCLIIDRMSQVKEGLIRRY